MRYSDLAWALTALIAAVVILGFMFTYEARHPIDPQVIKTAIQGGSK